jgi:hypothetical protein
MMQRVEEGVKEFAIDANATNPYNILISTPKNYRKRLSIVTQSGSRWSPGGKKTKAKDLGDGGL